MLAFTYGFLLALGLILPLGVQNIFILNQGATQARYINSIPSVLTASLCDTLLILLAVFGVSLTVIQLPILKNIIFGIGFLFLMYMGWITWNANTKNQHETVKPFSAKRQIIFAASVSLLNPHAIMDTVAVIGANSLHFMAVDKFIYTFSCVSVSWIWFFSLSLAGRYLRNFKNLTVFINKFSALIIWFVALYIGFELYQSSIFNR